MEVEGDERNDEAAVRDDTCNNGVGEIEGDKGKNDEAVEDSNDGKDDAASFIVCVVTAGAVATVAAVIADVKDCT